MKPKVVAEDEALPRLSTLFVGSRGEDASRGEISDMLEDCGEDWCMAKPLRHVARAVMALDVIPSAARLDAERGGTESVWIQHCVVLRRDLFWRAKWVSQAVCRDRLPHVPGMDW